MRPIPGYEGHYSIDARGNVWSEKRGKVLAPYNHYSRANIYKRLSLYKNGLRTRYFIHELVALTYLGPKPAGLQVNHKDCDPFNNFYKNLEYVTAQENKLHSLKFWAKVGA